MFPAALLCDADYQDDKMDPADFYKKNYRAIKANLEDDLLYGANYDKFDQYIRPQEINKKLFDKEEQNIPRGTFYYFDKFN